MKILMILTNHTQLGNTGNKTGFFLREVAYPYSILNEKGHEITLCSPKGGKVSADPLSLDYGEDKTIIKFYENEKIKEKLNSTHKPEDINSEDFKCIVFTGGHGTMWDFPENTALQQLTRKIYEKGGVVAAICHGPAIFSNLKLSDNSYLISGKKISCFTDEEEKHVKLENEVPFLLESKLLSIGAKHNKADKFQPYVEVDDRLITAQNPPSSQKFGEAIVDKLNLIK